MEMTTIRIAEKSSRTTEIAAPWANSIPSCTYPEISPVPRESTHSLICSRTSMLSSPWSSSQACSPSMSTSAAVRPVAESTSVT